MQAGPSELFLSVYCSIQRANMAELIFGSSTFSILTYRAGWYLSTLMVMHLQCMICRSTLLATLQAAGWGALSLPTRCTLTLLPSSQA